MRTWMSLLILVLAAPLAVGDEPRAAKTDDEPIEKERSAKALDLCRKGAKEYRLCLDDAQRSELALKTDPVLRWSNPAVGSIHGGVFMWTHEGRPAAVASIFKWFYPRTEMAFEVHSLSTERLVGFLDGKEVWKSSRPGVEYKTVPSAPVPAATATARLSQMRSMSGEFVAEKTDRDDNSKQRMRLLTQPVFRYSSRAADVIDGAMFAFVQGTDPEVLLLLEAQESKAGPLWKFALARMNSTAFSVTYKDKEAWSVEVVPWGVVFNNSEPYNILNLDHLSPPK
jgi:hypothetical protein